MCVCVCIGPVISNISNVIPLEAYVDAENTTSQDENVEDTPLVKPSEHGSPYRSEATKDSEHSFAREQSVTTGARPLQQEQHELINISMVDNESLLIKGYYSFMFS